MFAHWRRPSKSLRRKGSVNDQPPVAVDRVRSSGWPRDSCVSEEQGAGPLLVMVQRVAEILRTFLTLDAVGEPCTVGERDRHAGSFDRTRTGRRAVSGGGFVCPFAASFSRLGSDCD